MPSETLEYQFQESGLDELRSDMEALASGTQDVGEAAGEAAGELEDMSGTGTGVSEDMERAEESIAGVREEAASTAEEMEEEFTSASEAARRQIEDIQGQLEGLSGTDINVGDIGGELASSTVGAAVGAGGAAALAGQLTQAEAPAGALKSTLKQVSVEAKQASESMQEVAAADVDGPIEAAEKDAEDLEKKAEAISASFNEMEGVDVSLGGGEGGGGGGGLLGLGGLGGAASRLSRFAATTTAVASGIGAIGVAAATGTKQLADFEAQVASFGQQLKVAESQSGTSAQEIQQLFLVAQRLDSTVDLDAIRDAFKELALRTEEAREGTGEAKEAFDRLGISMQELEGMSTLEVFRRVRQEASKLTAQQRALTLEQVAGGEAGERLARVFGLQADEFQRLKREAMDDTLASGQITALDQIRQQYQGAIQDLQSIKRRLVAAFGGPATSILSAFAAALQNKVQKQLLQAKYLMDQLGLGAGSGVEMGPDKQMEFGRDGGGGSGGGEVAEPVQSMNDTLSRMETRVAVAKEKMSQGLIDKEEMLRQIKRARQSATSELMKLEEQAPELIPDSRVDSAIAKLKRIRRRLAKLSLMNATEQPVGATKVDGASPVRPGMQNPIGDIDPSGLGADMQQRAENMRRAYEEELSELETFGKAVGQSLTRSISRSVNRAFSALGEGLVDAIFGGSGGGRGEAQARLSLFNAKDQVRSLRKSLRQGNISYRNFQMKMGAQQAKIQQRQEKLNDTMKSGFAKAAESMLGAFKRIAKQLIAEITAVVAKMLVLKAITAAFSIGSGGFGGAVISQLGGGAFLDSGASGGMVKQSGLAVIHENEQIMNAETVSMLDGLLQPSTPSAQPAAMGGGGMNFTVQVQGETTTDGRDIKTAYDQTARIQRRKGRK